MLQDRCLRTLQSILHPKVINILVQSLVPGLLKFYRNMSERKSKTGFTKLASSQKSPYPSSIELRRIYCWSAAPLDVLPEDNPRYHRPTCATGTCDVWSFDSCHQRPPRHYRRMQSTRASSTYGGLGLAKPSELSSLEYEASVTVTEQHIVAHNYQLPDAVDMQSSKSQAGAKKTRS